MKITNVEIVDLDDDYENDTVAVTAETDDVERTFYVQTIDGEYRSSLGCHISCDGFENINPDYYPGFDIVEIINAAEEYIESVTALHEIGDIEIECEKAALLERAGTFYVVTENSYFINSTASPYDGRYNELARFTDKQLALDYIATNAD